MVRFHRFFLKDLPPDATSSIVLIHSTSVALSSSYRHFIVGDHFAPALVHKDERLPRHANQFETRIAQVEDYFYSGSTGDFSDKPSPRNAVFPAPTRLWAKAKASLGLLLVTMELR
jgi:hypothetical protein